MKTLPVLLEDEIDAALETFSVGQGRLKTDLAAEVLGKYVRAERLRQSLQDPSLVALYQELAGEDLALAEAGMGDYQRGLQEADRL